MRQPDSDDEDSEKIQVKGVSPLMIFYGFVPYIIMSLFSAPGTFLLVTSISVLMSASWMILGLVRGRGLHQLSTVGTILFGAMLVLAFVDPHLDTWLRNWSGSVAEIALVLTAFIGIAVKRPFTLYYARLSVDRIQWEHNPKFRAGVVRVSQTITAVWGLSFVIGVICDFLPSPMNNNIVFTWIIPLAALFGAIRFTLWYPEYHRSRRLAAHPEIAEKHRIIAERARSASTDETDDSG
ncbi:MAG: hypothetical protein U0990_06810 [Candidatus Nanopelagicales bacterium]|nr:hypothetical protein [Candidatus Nanopelagicales bacterium]MDZ4249786.1 hypothetical protein [Candidatus Nanopelagicales bacterium]